MTIAVALLEVDIRLEGGSSAIAGRAVMVPVAWVRPVLLVHVAVAVVTWIAWATLIIRSWRRFGAVLPGPFTRPHRRWGRAVFYGVTFTAASGTLLYVAAFV